MKKHYGFILALDPSGSFHEGKGTTGWCVIDATENTITASGRLSAKKYNTMEAYWDAHLDLIQKYKTKYNSNLIVIIEDYLLYAHKAKTQINSKMETCKLIGILQHSCGMSGPPYKMQTASEVKNRWSDKILLYKGYLQKKGRFFIIPLSQKRADKHCRDAIRHGVHFNTFRNKKGAKK